MKRKTVDCPILPGRIAGLTLTLTLTVLALLAGNAGAQTSQPFSAPVQLPAASAPAAPREVMPAQPAEPGYEVGPEDVLEISVWKEEGLKKEVLVRPDGGLSFPLAGDMQVTGMSAEQIRVAITERLTRFMPDPVVSVQVLKVANYKVYVIGRVNKPGDFSVGRNIDVLQALSMAGGLTPFAAENDIKIVRKQNGKSVTFPFEYSKVQRGTAIDQNITLKSGDVVLVP